jgi:hypothetical protein
MKIVLSAVKNDRDSGRFDMARIPRVHLVLFDFDRVALYGMCGKLPAIHESRNGTPVRCQNEKRLLTDGLPKCR